MTIKRKPTGIEDFLTGAFYFTCVRALIYI